MEKIKLFVDSGSDISKEDALRMDVEVLPLTRIMDGIPVTDYYDYDCKAYCDYLKTCPIIPTTSQPSPELFLEKYEAYMEEYDHILCITMSVYGSGTYNSAMAAKSLFEERHGIGKLDIHVVDSWSCGLNEVLELEIAYRLIQDGKPIGAVLAELDKVRRTVCTYYLVDNVEFLIRGGRVSTIKGSIAQKLKLKPIVNIKEGEGSNIANALGYQNGLSKMAGFFIQDCDGKQPVYISHADCPEKAMDLVYKLRETYINLEFHIHPMLGTMATQSGPGSIGMFYAKNK